MILHLFRDNIQIIRGPIIHQQLSIPIKNHSPEGRRILKLDAVTFGSDSIARAMYDLKEPQPQHQDRKDHNNNQRYFL